MALMAPACGEAEGGGPSLYEDTSAGDAEGSEAGDGSDAPPELTEADASAEVAGPPLALTPDLCEDPSNMEALIGAYGEEGTEISYGQVNMAQIERMASAPTEGPFYMVNLIRYREKAAYPDGRETDLSGREANARYAPIDFLTAIGARIVYASEAIDMGGEWDDVAIVEYPCPLAFFAMSAHPDFQARSVHKDAGVEESTVMVTFPQERDGGEVAEPLFPSRSEDPAFDLVRVHRYGDQARYAQGSEAEARSGVDAAARYEADVAEAMGAQGIHIKARLSVQGAVIGDGQLWHEVWIDGVPSQAAFEAFEASEAFESARHHLDAALDGRYEVRVTTQISDLPGADNAAGQALPTVTEDGTGTLCQSDDECPGEGVDTCFKPMGDMGFCSKEGCEPGGCQAPYLCCHSCSEFIRAMLPFEGSICIPQEASSDLEAAPASCTCE